MQRSAVVTVTAFGQGRFQDRLDGEAATVALALERHGIRSEGHRVAVNGHPAVPGAKVYEGDEVTVVPRVQGG